MFRVPFGDPVSVSLSCGPGRTKQSFVEECDVNNIMRRYERGQEITHVNPAQPRYFDASDTPADYLQACLVVRQAEGAFAQLPAAVRDRFANDPARLLSFLSDPGNRDEAQKLGLLREEAPERAPNAGVGDSSPAPEVPNA